MVAEVTTLGGAILRLLVGAFLPMRPTDPERTANAEVSMLGSFTELSSRACLRTEAGLDVLRLYGSTNESEDSRSGVFSAASQ
jgi:hypothetical protein